MIYNAADLAGIYETGRGSIKLRAKYHVDSKNNCIEITEIPYTTNLEAIIDKIVNLVKANKIRNINDVRDETDLNGLRITIDFKRNANPDHIMQKLFNMTTLCDTFSCNFNFLVDGKPRTMGVRECLEEWLRFRINCIRRQMAYDINKMTTKAHLLEGLSKILLDIDKAIRIIRQTEEDRLVIPNLMDGFGIDQPQAEFIAEIKLRNLNKEHILGRVNELDCLRKDIIALKEIMGCDKKIEEVITRQLRDVSKKFGKPRKTEIITEEEIIEIPDEELVLDYPIKVIFTEHNYFKKIAMSSLRAGIEQNLKDGDRIIQEYEAANKADILFFSDKCNVYKMKAHEIADCKASSMGMYLPNMLGTEENERIICIAPTTGYSEYMIFGFANGKVAKVCLEAYVTKVNRRKLVNAYSDRARIVYAGIIEQDKDFLAITDRNRALIFNTSMIATNAAKNAMGAQVLELQKNSFMVKMIPAERFATEEIERYRAKTIPAKAKILSGHEKDANDW